MVDERACGRRRGEHSHLVVVLNEEGIFLSLSHVCHTKASNPPCPVVPIEGRCRHHVFDKLPVDEVVALVARDRDKVGQVALAGIDTLWTIRHGLLVFHTIPVVMFHTLRIREAEYSASLTKDVTS